MRAQDQRGYILVFTIWMLALLTLAVSYFSLWIDNLIANTQAAKDEVRAQVDVINTKSMVYYLLATRRPDYKGLLLPGTENKYLRLDGTPYKGYGMARFTLQDEGGLLNMTSLTGQYNYLLERLGVPSGAVMPLINKLLDFMDSDNLKRIDGAEKILYKRADKEGPPNRMLMTSWEMYDVLDWDAYPKLWQPLPIARLVSVQDASGLINFNYAPRELLLLVDGVGEEEADNIIKARTAQPFIIVDEVYAAAGKVLNLNELELTFTPSRFVRLTLWSEKAMTAREIVYETEERSKVPFIEPIKTDYAVYFPVAVLGDALRKKADAISQSIF